MNPISHVVVKAPGGFVPNVDPRTRKATSDAQQFALSDSGSLTILPRSEWVAEPTVIEVGQVRY